MSKAFGIINFAGNNIQVNDMQAYRPIGAFSFLGRYRVKSVPVFPSAHNNDPACLPVFLLKVLCRI